MDDTSILTLSRRRSLRRFLLGLGGLAVIVLVVTDRTALFKTHDESPISSSTPAKSFVIASRKNDDVSWIEQNLPDWKLIRYVVDDPRAQYAVPENKGREAMVHLTWVILRLL